MAKAGENMHGQSNSLNSKKVLVVGAGGIGCNVLVHLAGGGIGEICLCDYDTVALSNFNRQFLYSRSDIGSLKAVVAAKKLEAYSPDTRFVPIMQRICKDNAADILQGCSLAVLACDNIETRLVLNEACTKMGTPLVNAGVEGLYGSAYLYIPGKTACLNCIYADSSESRDKSTVSEAAGAAGSLAARLAMAYLKGDFSNAGKLMLLDLQNYELNCVQIKESAGCNVCDKFKRSGE